MIATLRKRARVRHATALKSHRGTQRGFTKRLALGSLDTFAGRRAQATASTCATGRGARAPRTASIDSITDQAA